jgi:hypothetical protein
VYPGDIKFMPWHVDERDEAALSQGMYDPISKAVSRPIFVQQRGSEGAFVQKSSIRIMGGAAAALASVALFGSGVAQAADPLIGKTYADASSTISKWNASAVIATVSGDKKATDDCIVTSWHKSMFLDSSGDGPSAEVLVNLNCNGSVATAGTPGNSAASPEGRQAAKDNSMAEAINKNPAACQKSDAAMQWCQNLCNKTGLCEL